ncbi:hypothetical protein HMPREF0281_01268 [Corynebacterium ammoniagenes DSM 20306]|uniref:Uncharacterized protein n=1 Tax=Corynebacterium ammoniagenes DSM 20306 TaxID=649754 RepID=A0ABN0AFG2_CORAM|nr:hypothetical protein HMPREF0281_01268 [Corynebacterium ammoniagenes DSM 20306]
MCVFRRARSFFPLVQRGGIGWLALAGDGMTTMDVALVWNGLHLLRWNK